MSLLNRAISSLSFALSFTILLLGGCTTTAVLTNAALTSCGTSTVFLSAWYANVSDKSKIQADPMGGYQFAYWVDDAGNACHGDPGRNGQLGPAVINAYKLTASDLAKNQTSITEEQLKAFQEIQVPWDKYSGAGLHFVQFYNKFARFRADGKVFDSDTTISIPAVIEIGSKACVAPVALGVASRGLPLPALSPAATTQDPVRCRVRAMPSSATLSEDDRKKYDVFTLPHGLEFFDVR
jgi:hypothetical protein